MAKKVDRNTPSNDGVRPLKPRELETLKGGAQPGPEVSAPLVPMHLRPN